MQLCQGCGVHPPVMNLAGVHLCQACSQSAAWRAGIQLPQPGQTHQTGALSDLSLPGVLIPPLGVYQVLKGDGSSDAGSDGSLNPAGPIGQAGQSIGKGLSDTASSIKTVAIVVGVLVGVGIIYTIYKQAEVARQGQEHVFRLFAEHPEAAGTMARAAVL